MATQRKYYKIDDILAREEHLADRMYLYRAHRSWRAYDHSAYRLCRLYPQGRPSVLQTIDHRNFVVCDIPDRDFDSLAELLAPESNNGRVREYRMTAAVNPYAFRSWLQTVSGGLCTPRQPDLHPRSSLQWGYVPLTADAAGLARDVARLVAHGISSGHIVISDDPMDAVRECSDGEVLVVNRREDIVPGCRGLLPMLVELLARGAGFRTLERKPAEIPAAWGGSLETIQALQYVTGMLTPEVFETAPQTE